MKKILDALYCYGLVIAIAISAFTIETAQKIKALIKKGVKTMKKKNILVMFLTIVFLAFAWLIFFFGPLMPGLAIAQQAAAMPSAEPTMGDVFQSLFMNYVAPVLGSILLILFTFYVKKLLAKLGITLSAEQEKYMYDTAEMLVRATEERVAKEIKEKGNKVTFTGAAKLTWVVSALQEKFPALSSQEANKIAFAAVQKVPGIGLTGNT
ncbi:MAG: hypothetical protein A4E64_02143 [Syntrophorhabdus sp. PtaU1.Bin058]|nr:MAG: hypothetical protein A4E64_02143 [Syntrophorhabdus sp. PtaU1.Bin058]